MQCVEYLLDVTRHPDRNISALQFDAWLNMSDVSAVHFNSSQLLRSRPPYLLSIYYDPIPRFRLVKGIYP